MTNKRNEDTAEKKPEINQANKMPTILPMNEKCISFVKSGEKMNDIETIVRELVENSVDANSTRIDIKIAKFGKESIEIDDNGSGIEMENLDFIGKRHYTSKFSVDDKDFTDYHEQLTTFGFRGEALFCLCNIANVIVSTKTPSSPTGTRLIFNISGNVQKKELVARQNGTTVIVKNLFHSLPVRRKELESCGKRQYDKIVRLIYENVLVRPHIKFTLSKTNKMQVQKDFTHGGTTLENTIIAIFGSKVMESLIPINKSTAHKIINETQSQSCASTEDDNGNDNGDPESTCPIDETTTEATVEPISTQFMGSQFYKKRRSCRNESRQVEYKLHGYISKLDQGRHSNDGQFLFVNQKPCDVPRVSRLINEIYRNYSPNQTPFYCLFVQVQNWAADFNVPRKRAVILSEENKLYDMIKKILESMYSPSDPAGLDCMYPCSNAKLDIASYCDRKPPDDVRMIHDTENNPVENGADRCVNEPQSVQDKNSKIDNEKKRGPSEPEIENEIPTKKANMNSHHVEPIQIPDPFDVDYKKFSFSKKSTNGGFTKDEKKLSVSCKSPEPNDIAPYFGETYSMDDKQLDEADDSNYTNDADEKETPLLAIEYFKVRFSQNKIIDRVDGLMVRIDYSEDLADCLARERAHRSLQTDCKEYSYAIHPDFSRVSEDQLKVNLSRQSFENMDIVGQFNKGFIITRFNDHLFIVDQHASDERFNFEDQMNRIPLERQAMVRPKPLLLTLIQENVIIDNLSEFEKRGFKFCIDEAKMPGYRVSLSSTSICKGHNMDVHLDKSDIEELINIIINSPNLIESYTLEKVKNLSASRACRKSVMIGDTLSRPNMKNIIEKMAILKNPWICAHGRPTIRHLMDVEWMYRPIERPKWVETVNDHSDNA